MAKRPRPNPLIGDTGGSSSLSKQGEKRRKRKGKSRAAAADSTDVIDLTFDDASERLAVGSSSRLGSATSTPRFGNCNSFAPVPRSLIAGIDRSISPGPQSSNQPTTGGSPAIDLDAYETDQGQSSLGVANVGETLPDSSDQLLPMAPLPAQPVTSFSLSQLLLPANVMLDSSESAPLSAEPMAGIHFLDDDNNAKDVSRYFDTPKPEGESSFLATADQSKICSNCKRPGHKSRLCPHTLCPVCGAVDEHERRDCHFSLVCFGCGQRGHRQNVRFCYAFPN